MSRKMRIIAGQARSLPLRVPQGVNIRPTTDAMRESLFGSLGAAVEGANVVDLYAGSGAVGLEALSRGARQAVFVESNRQCLEAIKVNLANTHLARQALVVGGRVLKCWAEVAAEHGPFDIVFADPPYQSADLAELAARLIVQAQGVAEEGMVIVQHDAAKSLPVPGQPGRSKKLGQTQIDFFYFRRALPEEDSHES